MRSKTRKGLVLVSVFTFAAGMTLVSNAATWNYYSGYVQKTQDLVTSQQQKETTGSATNWVEYVEDNRKLTCWVRENTSGTPRLTNKVSYTDSGYVDMDYISGSQAIGKQTQLVVSTATTNFSETRSFGMWSPDYKR